MQSKFQVTPTQVESELKWGCDTLQFSNYSGWSPAVANTLRLKAASYAELGKITSSF